MTFEEFKRQVSRIPGDWEFRHENEVAFRAIKFLVINGEKTRESVRINGIQREDISLWDASFFRVISGDVGSLENAIRWLQEIADQIRPVESEDP